MLEETSRIGWLRLQKAELVAPFDRDYLIQKKSPLKI